MTEASEARAQANAGGQPVMPNGGDRARVVPISTKLHTRQIRSGDRDLVEVEGYASIVEKPYRMWDMFGEYDETIARGAFDKTLAAKPDVAFLVNHKGVTMARTTNGTLELVADDTGLRSRALLNPERQDVRDLVSAINDGLIDEMSFAFMMDERGAEWNDDFTEFRITQLDIDRGDVSAVNYGANPYTSIAARSREILADLDHLPLGARKAAMERLSVKPAQEERVSKPQSEGKAHPSLLHLEAFLATAQG